MNAFVLNSGPQSEEGRDGERASSQSPSAMSAMTMGPLIAPAISNPIICTARSALIQLRARLAKRGDSPRAALSLFGRGEPRGVRTSSPLAHFTSTFRRKGRGRQLFARRYVLYDAFVARARRLLGNNCGFTSGRWWVITPYSA